MSNSHTFALFVKDAYLERYALGSIISLDDDVVYHRLVRVLRVEKGEVLIIFDGSQYVEGIVRAISKQTVSLCVQKKCLVDEYRPEIIAALPLLKREDLHDAINGLVQVGVSAIQLVVSNKSQKSFDICKDKKRLESIVIAACEQSKNFLLPSIFPPITLTSLLQEYAAFRSILFHPTGISSADYFSTIDRSLKRYLLIVGPEGDFDQQEQSLMSNKGVMSVKLTPTILRAAKAAQLGVGIFRSMLSD